MNNISMECRVPEYICEECGYIGNDKISCKHSEKGFLIANNKVAFEIKEFLYLSCDKVTSDPKCIIKEIINVKKES